MNPATASPTQLDNPPTYIENNRNVAAYLCCYDLVCSCNGNGVYVFQDPDGIASSLAQEYRSGSGSFAQRLFAEKSKLIKMEKLRGRESKSPAISTANKFAPSGYIVVERKYLLDAKLSNNAFRVGLVLAGHVGADRTVYRSTEQLMKETGLSRHPVEDGRSELVKAGYIVKSTRHHINGNFAGWRYRVSDELLHYSQSNQIPQKGGTGTSNGQDVRTRINGGD